MTVVNITPLLATRNPTRARDLTQDQIAAAVEGIEEGVVMLSFATDSAIASEADDTLVRGLELIHLRLRRDVDRLLALL